MSPEQALEVVDLAVEASIANRRRRRRMMWLWLRSKLCSKSERAWKIWSIRQSTGGLNDGGHLGASMYQSSCRRGLGDQGGCPHGQLAPVD
jgi:hypothetical protein